MASRMKKAVTQVSVFLDCNACTYPRLPIGIYPSYFFDYGKPAGAKAFLDIIRTHIIDGAADGVVSDSQAASSQHFISAAQPPVL